MTRKKPTLLADLASHMGRQVAPGEFSGELGDGDLIAEVTVRIRRRVAPVDAQAWRVAAVAYLMGRPYLVAHCACNTKKKSPYSRFKQRCEKRVTAAVVTHADWLAPLEEGHLGFQFVCAVHAEHHGLRPEYVLGVVSFSAAELAPVRHAHDKAVADEAIRQHAAEIIEANIARGFACPKCGAAAGSACDGQQLRGSAVDLTWVHAARRDLVVSVRPGGA